MHVLCAAIAIALCSCYRKHVYDVCMLVVSEAMRIIAIGSCAALQTALMRHALMISATVKEAD